MSEDSKRYYQLHKEKLINYGKDYYKNNKIEMRKYNQKWRKDNPKMHRKQNKKYRKKNRKRLNYERTIKYIKEKNKFLLDRGKTFKIRHKTITHDGYYLLHFHGFNLFRIREHRYIMMKFLNRPLLDTESVHHIDGNKLNNHISNLELIDYKIHPRYHKQILRENIKLKRKIAILETQLKQQHIDLL